MQFDLPENELYEYRGSVADPADFDRFWELTLAEARSYDSDVQMKQVDTPLKTIDVFDVSFPGFGGEPIKAWLRMPHGASEPLPAVVEFVGYGGGRGNPIERLALSSAGYAHLIMDTRGQGSRGAVGSTPDSGASGPQAPGMVTKGIDSPETYYYRRLFTDAVRAVDAVRHIDQIDASKISTYGASQGGGIALAAAALSPTVSFLVAFVPFLCDIPRAITITDTHPYQEIVQYLATRRQPGDLKRTLATLAYFDGVNFAKRSHTPAYFSAGLMDQICPPSTIFAAYNQYKGEKTMTVWPFNGHEGGGVFDDEASLAALDGWRNRG
jgi:cephalosporin-C deacetylase